MTFRPLSEAFIRRSWYSVLPVLDTTGRRHVKKAVVCVAQLVAALITVHALLSSGAYAGGVFGVSEHPPQLRSRIFLSLHVCCVCC